MIKHKHKYRVLKEIYTNDFILYCEECANLIRVKDIHKLKEKNGRENN
jgi:hypothetical protein